MCLQDRGDKKINKDYLELEMLHMLEDGGREEMYFRRVDQYDAEALSAEQAYDRCMTYLSGIESMLESDDPQV